MTALFLALLSLATFAVMAQDARKALVAAVLLGNWSINTAFCWFTGDPNPWPFFIVTDYLSGLILVGFWRSRWQTAVIATYAAELVAHAAFGWSSGSFLARDSYWLILYSIAWLQVIITGGWIAYEAVRNHDGAARRMASAVAGFTRRKP